MILPDSVAFSGKWRIPLLRIDGKSYYPHRYVQKAIQFRKWRVVERRPNEVTLAYQGQKMDLSHHYFGLVLAEWHDRWLGAYIPPGGAKGMTVLDVGAGQGETAFLYFTHGARRVICVEPDPPSARMIQRNATANNWDVEIIQMPFESEMLSQFSYDFAKIDCEGCEASLLSLDNLPTACVIESHGHDLSRRLKEKFGLKTILVGKETDVLANY